MIHDMTLHTVKVKHDDLHTVDDPSIHLSIRLFIHLSIYSSIHLFIDPSIHRSIHSSIHPFIDPSIYLLTTFALL